MQLLATITECFSWKRCHLLQTQPRLLNRPHTETWDMWIEVHPDQLDQLLGCSPQEFWAYTDEWPGQYISCNLANTSEIKPVECCSCLGESFKPSATAAGKSSPIPTRHWMWLVLDQVEGQGKRTSKCYGRNYNASVASHELVLNVFPFFFWQASMINHSLQTMST